MARWTGTTAQRGLGSGHVADKKRLMAFHRDGDLCWRCGQPMYKWQELDRDHVVDRALGGTQGPAVLAHASCNRSAGARLGNKLQPRPRFTTGRDTICSACGRPYSRAPRQCEICGQHYHPNHDRQRSCGRACGLEVKRRNQRARGWVPPAQRPKPAPKPRRLGPVASGEREPANGWPATTIAYYTCRYCGQPGITMASARQRREVCPARQCQLARLAANNLVARKGMTREQADAAVVAYRAEGDHRQLRSTPGQIAADRRWLQTVTAVNRATARASARASRPLTTTRPATIR